MADYEKQRLTDEEEDRVHASIAAFSSAFLDSKGRLRREDEAALEAALKGVMQIAKATRRRPQKSILDFARDLLGANVLIGKRWGVRGTVVMIVSSTGTGKSVVQTQMAISFALGMPCCGMRPTRPFRSWIIQSEDDDDRIAIDRDDIIAEMSEIHTSVDFTNAATLGVLERGVRFLDFTSYTGAKFLAELERELALTPEEERPAAVFINPMNAYFGGSLKEGADCSAFFKGGQIQGKDTDGLEAIAKRYNVLVIIFGHTPKPPMPKELKDWVNDPNIAYKMCGASEIADAVRSILVFLPCPDEQGLFVFNAGKNGYSLGWTDASGNTTTKAYFRWATSGKHFWEEVPKEEWPVTQGEVAQKGELEADIAVVLAHMDAPGLNRTKAEANAKEWGMGRNRARKAFYAIVRNRAKYGVVTNIVHNEHGQAVTLYCKVQQSAAQVANAQTQPEPEILTDEIQI